MKSFEVGVGDRVMTISDNEILRGTVRSFIAEVDPPILIVKFDDGTVSKVRADNVVHEIKAETQPEKKGLDLNKEITITLDEFVEKCSKVINTDETLRKAPAELHMAWLIFSAVITKALFVDEADDD